MGLGTCHEENDGACEPRVPGVPLLSDPVLREVQIYLHPHCQAGLPTQGQAGEGVGLGRLGLQPL